MNIIRPRHSRPSAPDGFGDGVRPPARTPRRRAHTLLLGALIPTTFAAGLLTAATATAGLLPAATVTVPDTARSTQVQVSRPQYSRGFEVSNGGTHNLKLVSVAGDHFGSTPDIGHVLPPNGTDNFEVPFTFLENQYDHATYDILDDQGRKIGTYTADMTVISGTGTSTSDRAEPAGSGTAQPATSGAPLVWVGHCA
jgi:hypothetical protein